MKKPFYIAILVFREPIQSLDLKGSFLGKLNSPFFAFNMPVRLPLARAFRGSPATGVLTTSEKVSPLENGRLLKHVCAKKLSDQDLRLGGLQKAQPFDPFN